MCSLLNMLENNTEDLNYLSLEKSNENGEMMMAEL